MHSVALRSSIKELACKSGTKPTQKAQVSFCEGMLLPAMNVEKAIKMVMEPNKAQDYWTVCTGCTYSFNKINAYIKRATIRLQRVLDYKVGEKL